MRSMRSPRTRRPRWTPWERTIHPSRVIVSRVVMAEVYRRVATVRCRMDLPDVLVVGAGPNGLAAAVTLAREGLRVRIVERGDEAGGGARSAESTLPGLIHDLGSAVHPFAAGSPVMSAWPLRDHGLRWVHPPLPLAHPLRHGAAARLEASLDATVAGLGDAGPAWRALTAPATEAWPRLAPAFLGPLLRPPRAPLHLARFGARAVLPAGWTARVLPDAGARALWAGLAAHASLPLEAPGTSAVAITLAALGQRVGRRGGRDRLGAPRLPGGAGGRGRDRRRGSRPERAAAGACGAAGRHAGAAASDRRRSVAGGLRPDAGAVPAGRRGREAGPRGRGGRAVERSRLRRGGNGAPGRIVRADRGGGGRHGGGPHSRGAVRAAGAGRQVRPVAVPGGAGAGVGVRAPATAARGRRGGGGHLGAAHPCADRALGAGNHGAYARGAHLGAGRAGGRQPELGRGRHLVRRRDAGAAPGASGAVARAVRDAAGGHLPLLGRDASRSGRARHVRVPGGAARRASGVRDRRGATGCGTRLGLGGQAALEQVHDHETVLHVEPAALDPDRLRVAAVRSYAHLAAGAVAHQIGQQARGHLAQPDQGAVVLTDELAFVIRQTGGRADLGLVHGVTLAESRVAGAIDWASAQRWATLEGCRSRIRATSWHGRTRCRPPPIGFGPARTRTRPPTCCCAPSRRS